MKKREYICVILLFVAVAAFAGRRVTIRLDGRPVVELIEAIEGQTASVCWEIRRCWIR